MMRTSWMRWSAWCCLWVMLLWSSKAMAHPRCSPSQKGQQSAACAPPQKRSVRPTSPRKPAPQGTPGRVIAGWLLLSLGALFVGGSSVMFGIMANNGNALNLARLAHEEGDCDLIKDRTDPQWKPCADTLATFQAQQADYEALSGLAIATFALGSVVLLTSAVLLGLPSPAAPAPTAPPPTKKPPPRTIILLQAQ